MPERHAARIVYAMMRASATLLMLAIRFTDIFTPPLIHC